MEIYLVTKEVPYQSYWDADGLESHTHMNNLHVVNRYEHVFVDLLYTLKQELLVTILHYFHQQPLLFCIHAMRICREHGIICAEINFLLFLERHVTLKKLLDFSIHSSHVSLLR